MADTGFPLSGVQTIPLDSIVGERYLLMRTHDWDERILERLQQANYRRR